MKSKIYLLIAAAGIVAASSCKKFDTTSLGNKSINSLNAKADTDVYVVGEAAPQNWPGGYAAYWKNGVRTALTDTTSGLVGSASAAGIAIHDTDVYITGMTFTSGKTTAVYWRNGQKIVLADNASVGGNIAISSCGCDVYIPGEVRVSDYDLRPVYWKNGVQHMLPGSPGFQLTASSIAIHGGNVYVAGYAKKNSADYYGVYWKNDTLHYLTDPSSSDFSIASGIDVKGNDVYVSGYSHFFRIGRPDGTGIATYWKNGTPVVLNGATPSINALNLPSAIAINNGNDVYVTGSIAPADPTLFQVDAAYWVNNVITHFPPIDNNTERTATAIAFAGHDVYISGTTTPHPSGNPYAGYWKNGNTFVRLPGRVGIGSGVAVVTHPHH